MKLMAHHCILGIHNSLSRGLPKVHYINNLKSTRLLYLHEFIRWDSTLRNYDIGKKMVFQIRILDSYNLNNLSNVVLRRINCTKAKEIEPSCLWMKHIRCTVGLGRKQRICIGRTSAITN